MGILQSPVRIVTVSAGLGSPSSTRLLADQLGQATSRGLDGLGAASHVETVDLRPLAHPLADALVTGFPSGDLARAVDQVARADAVIAVTPVFQASYSGLFKTFFDVLEPEALVGTPVLMGATAGTARHSLVLEHAMRPLFAHLKAITVPTAVFAASEDFGSTTDGTLADRVARASRELARLAWGRVAGAAPAPQPEPGHTGGATVGGSTGGAGDGDLPEPIPFAEMLSRI